MQTFLKAGGSSLGRTEDKGRNIEKFLDHRKMLNMFVLSYIEEGH